MHPRRQVVMNWVYVFIFPSNILPRRKDQFGGDIDGVAITQDITEDMGDTHHLDVTILALLRC